MANQRGFLKLEGTLGDVTFIKTARGYEARQKGGVKPGRMSNDPAFERTREHQAEFGRACKGSKHLRSAFPALIKASADSYSFSRLGARLLKVIQSDTTNVRGERSITGGTLALVNGFEFNVKTSLSSVFTEPLVVTSNPATGVTDVNIAGFIPRIAITAPNEATHYRLDLGAGCIDFGSGTFESKNDSTGYKPLDHVDTGSLGLNCTLVNVPATPMVVVFGIQFSMLLNGVYYPLNNGAFNALSIVKVVE